MSEKIWDEIGKKLDEFYESSDIQEDESPSSMLREALTAMDRKGSPGWMVHAAHSLRDIFYEKVSKMKILLTEYGSIYDKDKGKSDIKNFYGFFSAIAHHKHKVAGINELVGGSKNNLVKITPEIFEGVVRQFGEVVFSMLKRQLDAHREIDEMLRGRPGDVNRTRELINLNSDAHEYFFYAVGDYRVDKRWLDWLWKEGFLDILKGESDKREGILWLSEVAYLKKMAAVIPEKVADIISQIRVSSEMSNLATIDHLFGICAKLPASQIPKLTKKIRDEKWVVLKKPLDNFDEFEYRDIAKKLFEAREYDALLKFVQAIFTLRDKEKAYPYISEDNPLCFNIRSSTKIFRCISDIDDEFVEQAFNLIGKTMADIIAWGNTEKNGGEERFEDDNIFDFEGVDFFSTDLERRIGDTHYGEVYGVMAVAEKLARRLIEREQDKPDEARRIYERCIDALPKNNPAMFRFRIYLLSLYPDIFGDKLKHAFFLLFDVGRCYCITGGAEYKIALKKCFTLLSNTDKRDYVSRAIHYFTHGESKDREKEMRIYEGSKVFSVIESHLTEQEEQRIREAGFEIYPNFQPEVGVKTSVGRVNPRGPIPQEDIAKLSVLDIAQKLGDEWSPRELAERKVEDPFNPINIRGVYNLLEKDMPNRLQEYVSDAAKFFNPGVIDENYTRLYLRGIEKVIKSSRKTATEIDWRNLMELFTLIMGVGKNKQPMEKYQDWFAMWRDTHFAMANVLEEVLVDRDQLRIINFSQYKDSALSIIRYLLSYPDPLPRDEETHTARIKIKKTRHESLIGDPYTIAINSVRGEAFRLLVIFIQKDAERFKMGEVKIADEVKELYELVLMKENTRALMFMFGLHLADFYCRDKNWLRNLLPKIFPADEKKKNLYTAAWEGYLSNDPYTPLFSEPYMRKLYDRGISLTDIDYPEQDHHEPHPNKGIATHFVFGFIHDDDWISSPLFRKFWEEGNFESQWYFIEILGRISIAEPSDYVSNLMEERPKIKERLLGLWDQLLREKSECKVLFTAFGSWTNPEVDILDPTKTACLMMRTLEKTNGKMGWDYCISKSTPRLAADAPQETLKIIELLLLEGYVRSKEQFKVFSHWDSEMNIVFNILDWEPALEILYNKPETKSKVEILINKLVEEGGKYFWVLKGILS